MVVVGIGVEHDKFVSMAEKYFNYPAQSTIVPIKRNYSSSNDILRGGSYHVDMDGMQLHQISLGLHCGGWQDKSGENWKIVNCRFSLLLASVHSSWRW